MILTLSLALVLLITLVPLTLLLQEVDGVPTFSPALLPSWPTMNLTSLSPQLEVNSSLKAL